MAGVTRLELATSCVTGRRSNRLSYTPDKGRRKLPEVYWGSSSQEKMIRTTDAKEVGVGNTAEETCRCPNQRRMVRLRHGYVNPQISPHFKSSAQPRFRPKSGEKPRNKMAEREGFEPPLPFQVITLSRRAPSTAQPPLQQAGAHCVKSRAKRQVI